MPEHVTTFAMNLGQLETEVLRKLWVDPKEDSDGHPADVSFNYFTKYRVDKKINQACAEMVVYSRALKSWFIVVEKENYYQYPVPLWCYDIEKVYRFSSATTYSELELLDEETIEEEFSPGWRTLPSTPQYAFACDRNKMVIKLGIAPPPSSDGVAPTLATGVYTRAQPYGAVEGINGSAGPGSVGDSYVDALGQDFTELGVIPGLTLWNITDGSTGVITSINTTGSDNDTLVCSGGFSGGTVNAWTPGDEMQILGGEYGGQVTIGDLEASYILGSTMGSLPGPGITMGAGSLLVRGYSYPALLRVPTQYPELPPIFHPLVAIRAASLLGLEEPADTARYTQALRYQEEFNSQLAILMGYTADQFHGRYQILSKRRDKWVR